MICCFILYPTYHNRELHHKNKANEDLNLEEPPEIKHSYDRFQDSDLKNLVQRISHADKTKKFKLKFE